MHDADTRDIDPKFIRDDLRQRGPQPLAMRRDAHAGLDIARRCHADLNPFIPWRDLHRPGGEGRRAVAGSFVEHAEPGRRGMREAVHQVAPPDIQRIDPERLRRMVHQALDPERDGGPGDTAIGRHRACVRRHATRPCRIVRHAIRAGIFRQRHQRLHAAGDGIAGECADICNDIDIQRPQRPVGIESGAQLVALISAVRAGDQVFPPVLDPGEPAAIAPRQPDQQDVFGEQRHFLAEPAADIGRHHPQVGLCHPQAVGDSGAKHVRHLG